MVEGDRSRAEKSVEIDQTMAVRGIVEVRSPTLFQVDDNTKAVEQNVLLETLKNAGRVHVFPVVLCSCSAPTGGRFGEHGRHTHPLRVVSAAQVVNRCDPTKRPIVNGLCAAGGSLSARSAIASSALRSISGALKCIAAAPTHTPRSRQRRCATGPAS